MVKEIREEDAYEIYQRDGLYYFCPLNYEGDVEFSEGYPTLPEVLKAMNRWMMTQELEKESMSEANKG